MQPAAHQSFTSCFCQKLLGAVCILSMLIMGISAFTTPSEELAGATGNCSFLGMDSLVQLGVQGEPVALRCPLLWSPLGDTANSRYLLTWRRNGSTQVLPEAQPRMQAKDGALWILPAMLEDTGIYICTVRDGSHCEESSLELKIFEDMETYLTRNSYSQILILGSDSMLTCPHTHDFAQDEAGVRVWWYKGSVLLGGDGGRFHNVEKKRCLVVVNASMEDEGYYRCVLTFTHEGRRYNLTRSVRAHLRENTHPVILSPLDNTISASLGSRLTIPCKASLGTGLPSSPFLLWMSNTTHVEPDYSGGRVTQGPLREYSENGERFIEMPLNLDPVIREDLNTVFKCIISSAMGLQTLRTTVTEAPSTFSWRVALAPLSLVLLVLGGICMHQRCKRRARKAYGLTTPKTGFQDFYPIPEK